jgi:hypothetical protein
MADEQKTKKRIPLWVVLLIAAALGLILGLLFPITGSLPM